MRASVGSMSRQITGSHSLAVYPQKGSNTQTKPTNKRVIQVREVIQRYIRLPQGYNRTRDQFLAERFLAPKNAAEAVCCDDANTNWVLHVLV